MLAHARGAPIEVWAPAKLNLFLEVLGRRADGYHDLETVMTAINLYDTLIFRAAKQADAKADIELQVHWSGGPSPGGDLESGTLARIRGEVPLGQDNLVVRALQRLRTAAGVDQGATVTLVKRIPAAAGLGGASSDAAAALWAGNLGWGLHWPRTRLHALAEQLGSDVPFFLTGRTSVCRGRGEIITPLPMHSRWHVVVVRPPVGLATGDVFRHCQVPATAQRRQWLGAGVRQATPSRAGELMFNRLQFAAERLTPWIDRMRREFQHQQVIGHQLTGSGSCYFGVCHNRLHATRVARRLANRGRWMVFQSVTDSAMHTRVREHCHS